MRWGSTWTCAAISRIQRRSSVGDQHTPQLLAHQRGLLAAQHRLTFLQGLLDLPEPQLDLPALVVELGQLLRRMRGDTARM